MSDESFEIPTLIKIAVAPAYFLALQDLLRRVIAENESESFIQDQLLAFSVLTPEQIVERLAEQVEPDLGNTDLLNLLEGLESGRIQPGSN